MFYSHEVLTSRKYGFATVWLVATLGSNTKKVTRKAILDVDIGKTCDTIVGPAVPLALRLQSNLLVGVVKVYSQHCQYVLTNAESVRTQLRSNVKATQSSGLVDPGANISVNRLLQDDPSFLPELEFGIFNVPLDEDPYSNLAFTQSQQESTPGRGTDHSELSLGPDLRLASMHTPMTQVELSEVIRSGHKQEKPPFEGLQEDLGLIFEPDGDIVMQDTTSRDHSEREAANAVAIEQAYDMDVPMGGLMQSNDLLEPVIDQSEHIAEQNIEVITTSETASAPLRARPRQRKVVPMDANIELSTATLRAWQNDYLENMEQNRSHKAATSQGLARRNAHYWLLDDQYLSHDALAMFSVQGLLDNVTASLTTVAMPSSEGVGIDPTGVKPQHDTTMYDDIEYGREQPTPLDENRQSSLLPWNSSILRHRAASSQAAGSYMAERARFSSLLPQAQQSPGAPVPSSAGLAYETASVMDHEHHIEPADDSQWSRNALQNESLNFLAFVKDININSTATTMNTILAPTEHTTATAAQAFLHLLVLATQQLLMVEQNESFADIQITLL